VVELRYLYVGSSDVSADVAGWSCLPGSRVVWRFRHLGADVAAVDPGRRPVVLVADHRPPASVLPIYATEDLDADLRRFQDRGWELAAGPLGTPEGPACVLRNRSGVELGLLRVDRPGAMEAAFADPANTHAVRDG